MKCIKDRCYSPVACGGFGYCRELNFAHAAPIQDLLVDIWFHLADTDDATLRGIADRARALIPDHVGGSRD